MIKLNEHQQKQIGIILDLYDLNDVPHIQIGINSNYTPEQHAINGANQLISAGHEIYRIMTGDKKKMTQTELSKATGISQPEISKHLREIREGHIIRPNILKILRVQGKGDKVDAFIREVQK